MLLVSRPLSLHAPPWVIWYSALGRARENRLPGCFLRITGEPAKALISRQTAME